MAISVLLACDSTISDPTQGISSAISDDESSALYSSYEQSSSLVEMNSSSSSSSTSSVFSAVSSNENTLSSSESSSEQLSSSVNSFSSETEKEPEGCPSADIFEEKVQTIRLTVTEANLEELELNGYKEEYVPAEFTFNDTILGSVGLRHKGSDSSMDHCWPNNQRNYKNRCSKISMKLKFNKYNDDTRLCGMKRLNLHALRGGSSNLIQQLGYQMFRDMGVMASRSGFTKVYINDEYWGVFATVEQIDGRFTADRWPEAADGNLYKEVWPGIVGPTFWFEETEWVWDNVMRNNLKTNEDIADHSAMTQLHDALKNTTYDTFEEDIEPLWDLENFARLMAVDRALANIDGVVRFISDYESSPVSNTTNHNFYFYQMEGTDKFTVIPWDLDLILWHPDDIENTTKLPNWNYLPDDCETNFEFWQYAKPAACDKFFNLYVQHYWDQYVTASNELLAGPFQLDAMYTDIDRWAALIEQAVIEDPYLDVDDWRDQVGYLKGNLQLHRDAFVAHIAEGLQGF